VGDYSTNEPTMDGTASLVYYLSAMEKEGERQRIRYERSKTYQWEQGAIIRGDSLEKSVALVFTGDKYADGAAIITKTLRSQKIKASFFLTGNFYRNPLFREHIKSLVQDGHYLGAHSDRHLLYCDWQIRDSLLISKKQFNTDINNNYQVMENFGIRRDQAKIFLPPFEWYNKRISDWAAEEGLQLINYTPGTLSHADYTIPSMNNHYIDSDSILKSIFVLEESKPSALNGFILLMHIGSHPERTDKLYSHLNELIEKLSGKGYHFKRIDELLFW
jgi:peptidoglycan/xylan/chitin deacetylase (PgdA/CDA1 family)